jgi:hypothetical protein
MTSSQPYMFPGIDGPNSQPIPIMGHLVLHVVTYPASNGSTPIAPPSIMPPTVPPITPPEMKPAQPVNPSDQDDIRSIPRDQQNGIGGWARSVQGAPQSVMFRRQQDRLNGSGNGTNIMNGMNDNVNRTGWYRPTGRKEHQ